MRKYNFHVNCTSHPPLFSHKLTHIFEVVLIITASGFVISVKTPFLFQIIYQKSEYDILAEKPRNTCHEHLLPRSCKGYIKFSVNQHSAFFHEVGELFHLVFPVEAEGVYDDIALAALIPLHCVNGDFAQGGNPP